MSGEGLVICQQSTTRAPFWWSMFFSLLILSDNTVTINKTSLRQEPERTAMFSL